MIIKLHEVRTDMPYPVYVNTDHIQYFAKSINGSDTRIKFNGEKVYMFVKESIEEVAEMIRPVLSEPLKRENWLFNGASK